MARKSSGYWKKRMAEVEDAGYQSGAAYYKDVQEQYQRAFQKLQADMELWYARLAANNEISYAEAKKLLNENELEEFKWTVEQYIKAGKENAIDQRWMRELENASAKYHISRLEAMKLQLQQHAELLSAEFEGGMTDFLRKSYGDQYYRTAYEIAKGSSVGSNLVKLDTRKIDLLLKKPWAQDGKNFSDRIWSNKEKLVQNLHTNLTQSIIRGESPKKAIDGLSKAMNVSKSQAGNLIMTETAALSSRAQQSCFKELGVEEFEVVETLDGNTCEVCRGMDGKHFPMSDYRVGETAPPFHPRCRGCTCPYFDDEFSQLEKRAARDPKTGDMVYVPADMTYKEWHQAFVKDDKNELSDIAPGDMIDAMDITAEWTKNKGTQGTVSEKHEYTLAGTTYRVDGKHVVLHPTAKEKAVAASLSSKYGKAVELVPQILYPQGMQTPDYLIDGERFDLKSPTGSGKNLLYGMIAKKRRQSHNFIIDITECPLSIEELEKQAGDLYRSPRVGFLEKIVFMKNGEVEKVFDRK